MTGFAGDTPGDVRPVVEMDEVGLLEDPGPLNRLARLPLLYQAVNVGLIFGVLRHDGDVTAHAPGDRGQTGHGTRLRAGVTEQAVDASFDMFPVLENQGLQGSSEGS
jgi:hypothetical protein